MGKNKNRNYLKLRDPTENLDFGRLMAEQDDNLALYYILDEKYVRRALSIDDPAIYFVGPKGIGKSAILKMVQLRQRSGANRVIEIRPDDLAFSALANAEATSPILTDASRNQWIFRSLWDYVLALEVFRREYPDPTGFSRIFPTILQGAHEQEARKLLALSTNGGTITFTDRILQLIHELEVSGEFGGVKMAATIKPERNKSSAGTSFQLLALVNSVAKKLHNNLSNDYYILIDDLDLYWTDSPTQNAFIASLFMSLIHFSRPPHIKAVVSLRENIFNTLPLPDRDKLPDSVCRVRWDYDSVKRMVEERVCFRLVVTNKEIWGELFPQNGFELIWKHSNGRPREAIRLATLAANTAVDEGHLQITPEDMVKSIRVFSEERIKEVTSEVAHKYPGLEFLVRKMCGWPREFPFEKIKEFAELLNLEVEMKEGGSEKFSWAGGFAANPIGFAQILLENGVLWLKLTRHDEPKAFDPNNRIEITTARWFAIHPMFAPALGLG